MAFSFRKIISNITYFKKPGDEDKSVNESVDNYEIINSPNDTHGNDNKPLDFEHSEADSTSKMLGTSLIIPDSVKKFAAKKGSLSDTDILSVNVSSKIKNKHKRKSKKLKLDIGKANQSCTDSLNSSEECNIMDDVENTPKHVLLQCKSSEVYNERLKVFDFNKSFHFDESYISDEHEATDNDEQIDIESISEESDSDASTYSSEEKSIKMCRKVEDADVPSTTPESFEDVELGKNEEERMLLLINYQMKLEKIERFLKKLLLDFQFHIEVSKVFNSKSSASTLTKGDISNIPKIIQNFNQIDKTNRADSPVDSWNLLIDTEDIQMKDKVKNQLLTIKLMIEEFSASYFTESDNNSSKSKYTTFNVRNKSLAYKQQKNKYKKKLKRFDFPDYRDAMIQLFYPEDENINEVQFDDTHPLDTCKCCCHSSPSQTDSGVTDKTEQSISNQSISSSIGNFTLDCTTLSAYSESLDQIVSYNSFDDTSLYSTMLKKPAIERITFYIQVHSIQINAQESEEDYESKNIIMFRCTSCKIKETEENGLLKHILSQLHCEKIHFIYKTAYIKKCVATGQEIQPSTVLNPMKVYRDDNKIVCFGDAKYACSLCFESMIVGESMLMAHCSESEHVDRRQRLCDILED